MSEEFHRLLLERAEAAEISIEPTVQRKLEQYFDLLAHWNQRINLTSLPLDPPSIQTVDRLFIEPLTAVSLVKPNIALWFDLGSGGGSPAIPLQLAHPASQLVMVESRERKAAFLRETIRELGLPGSEVAVARIEAVAAENSNAGVADLVTVRAVRLEPSMIGWIQTLLRFGGQAVLFGADPAISHLPRGLDMTGGVGGAHRGVIALRRSGV
jgi:16S rRNA (guanine527-N7)-methyltransferase